MISEKNKIKEYTLQEKRELYTDYYIRIKIRM